VLKWVKKTQVSESRHFFLHSSTEAVEILALPSSPLVLLNTSNLQFFSGRKCEVKTALVNFVVVCLVIKIVYKAKS